MRFVYCVYDILTNDFTRFGEKRKKSKQKSVKELQGYGYEYMWCAIEIRMNLIVKTVKCEHRRAHVSQFKILFMCK